TSTPRVGGWISPRLAAGGRAVRGWENGGSTLRAARVTRRAAEGCVWDSHGAGSAFHRRRRPLSVPFRCLGLPATALRPAFHFRGGARHSGNERHHRGQVDT